MRVMRYLLLAAFTLSIGGLQGAVKKIEYRYIRIVNRAEKSIKISSSEAYDPTQKKKLDRQLEKGPKKGVTVRLSKKDGVYRPIFIVSTSAGTWKFSLDIYADDTDNKLIIKNKDISKMTANLRNWIKGQVDLYSVPKK